MPAPDRSVRVADGEVLGLDDTSQHWICARYLLEAVESQAPNGTVKWNDFVPDSSRDDHVRLWYRAAAAWQGNQRRWSEAMATLARGAELFPDDGPLTFYRGAMHEIFATPEVQGAVQSAIRSGIGLSVVVDRRELAAAEALLRRAAEIAPDNAEVRLRLGRVLQLLDRHDEAARELKEAAGVLTDPALVYDATLFLGVSQQALGDRDGARASFERAGRLAPGAQSPLLALSQLARRAGNSAAALEPLGRLLASGRVESEPDDPWWSYPYAHVRDAGLLMAQMRRILWSGATK
jgi:tetratricopeptide (TPR) repeat protein